MPKWNIPVKYTQYAIIEVEAPTLMEAMDKAERFENRLMITDSNVYEGLWELYPEDEKEVRERFNDGQEDE